LRHPLRLKRRIAFSHPNFLAP